MKSPSKEDDVAPKTDMTASPSDVFSTPTRETVATPPKQGSKPMEGVEGVTPIENEEYIEDEIMKGLPKQRTRLPKCLPPDFSVKNRPN